MSTAHHKRNERLFENEITHESMSQQADGKHTTDGVIRVALTDILARVNLEQLYKLPEHILAKRHLAYLIAFEGNLHVSMHSFVRLLVYFVLFQLFALLVVINKISHHPFGLYSHNTQENAAQNPNFIYSPPINTWGPWA